MRIIPSCSCVSTIVWQHHLNSIREKARWRTTQGCCVLFWSNFGSHTRQKNVRPLIPITQTMKVRRAWHGGYWWRSKKELTCDVLQMDTRKRRKSALSGYWMSSDGWYFISSEIRYSQEPVKSSPCFIFAYVDQILQKVYMNFSTNSRLLRFNEEMAQSRSKHINSNSSEFRKRPMPLAVCSRL